MDDVEYKFNLITMFHVLEHIPHQVKILKALKKKLNKNGKIIIEVPHAKDFLIECLNIKEFKNFTFWSEHLVLHTIKSLEKVIKKAGFKKIKLIYFQRYNINNHFGWIIKGKPGGHDFYKKLFGKNFQERYEVFLKKKGYTDTIIATAEN